MNNRINFEEISKNCSIAHSDSLKILDGLKKKSVHMILTDPPYNLGKFMHDRNTNMGKLRKNHFSAAGWDKLDYGNWHERMDEFFGKAARVIKIGGSMIVFMSIMKAETIIELAGKHGFYYKTTGIWHKKNPMPRNMNLHFINSTESWIYFTYKKHTGTFNNKGKAIHDFVETGLTPATEKKYGVHSTQKPEELVEHFILILTNKGNTVLDPFMGSGTTAVVCKKLGRKFVGIEISKKYFNIAKKRIRKT